MLQNAIGSAVALLLSTPPAHEGNAAAPGVQADTFTPFQNATRPLISSAAGLGSG